MTLRRAFLLLASAALGVALIVALVRVSRIDVRSTLHLVRQASWFAVAKLIALNGIVVYLSTEKWRSIDAALRHASDSVPSRYESFALSSLGMALGLVLPVQLGLISARTLGTYFRGRPFVRGTAGTMVEQSFDLLCIGLFAIATVITVLCRGKALTWIVCAAAFGSLALLAPGPSVWLINWLASRLLRMAPTRRIGDTLSSFSQSFNSRVFTVKLARRLIVLSEFRFVAVVLIAYETSVAIGSGIPLWQIAAAMPLVLVAGIVVITPGALGVNELTSVTVLNLFGTPLGVSAQWALANRILSTAACFAVAVFAAVGLLAVRLVGERAQKVRQ
jgi:uncharacterized protein (TIRG00374 family)